MACAIVALLLVLAAPAGASWRPPDPGPPGPWLHASVTFTVAEAPDVILVTYDRWRGWRVSSRMRLSRGERCQYKIDAIRVLRGQHVTIGLPFRCMSPRVRKLRPDPAPQR